MRPLDPILEKLSCAQRAFFGDGRLRPCGAVEREAEGERVVGCGTGGASGDCGTNHHWQRGPSDAENSEAVPFLKRFHFPMWLVESRIIRRKSPIPLDSSLLNTKEEMLGELRAARERTLAFLQETSKRDLSAYCWPHPFLGMLNVYEWFEMIASHEIRHTKQMKEIAAGLPKAVESA